MEHLFLSSWESKSWTLDVFFPPNYRQSSMRASQRETGCEQKAARRSSKPLGLVEAMSRKESPQCEVHQRLPGLEACAGMEDKEAGAKVEAKAEPKGGKSEAAVRLIWGEGK